MYELTKESVVYAIPTPIKDALYVTIAYIQTYQPMMHYTPRLHSPNITNQ